MNIRGSSTFAPLTISSIGILSAGLCRFSLLCPTALSRNCRLGAFDLTYPVESLSSDSSARLNVNTPVDDEKLTASLEDGVLTLTLPVKPTALPRQIAVN